MIEEVGSLPHNLANSSPVAYGDLIFVSTSNGQDESHVNVPSPKVARDHCRQQEDRQTRLGRQFGSGTNPSWPVVLANCGNNRRRGPGGSWTRRRLGSRL